MYQRIIMETADVNKIISSFTRKLQFLFINKVRTRPAINLNILALIKLIESVGVVVVVIEYVCGHNDDSGAHKIVAVLCASAVSTHIICVMPPSPTEPGSDPPLPSEPRIAKQTTPGYSTEQSH